MYNLLSRKNCTLNCIKLIQVETKKKINFLLGIPQTLYRLFTKNIAFSIYKRCYLPSDLQLKKENYLK